MPTPDRLPDRAQLAAEMRRNRLGGDASGLPAAADLPKPLPASGSGPGGLDAILDAEADLRATLEETTAQRQDRREKARFLDVTDSEYWVAVCFSSRSQKEAFIRGLGLDPVKDGDKYLDGQKLAAAVGVDLPADKSAYRAVTINKRWMKHVMKDPKPTKDLKDSTR